MERLISLFSAGMDYKSSKQLKGPKSLKSLAFDKKDAHGNNLLHRFVLNNCTSDNSSIEGYIGVVLRSMSGEEVNAMNEEGYTALHMAVKKQNYLMVKKLLTYVPSIDVKVKSSIEKETALHMAADSSTDSKDAIAIINFLIKKGAYVNDNDRNSNTPLHVSVANKALEIVKVLVENGHELNDRNDHGYTPLHIATEEGHLEIVKVLVEKGAGLNLKNYDGDTPLHIAVKENSLEIVIILVERGYENNWNDHGHTPLYIATKEMYLEIVQVLVEKCAVLFAQKDNVYF